MTEEWSGHREVGNETELSLKGKGSGRGRELSDWRGKGRIRGSRVEGRKGEK